MVEQQERQVNIDNGGDFFAHEISVHFNPTQFIFDFKCITPRIDVRAKDNAVINIRHNTVMIDAWQAKELREILDKVITNYEKQFGKIDKPASLKNFEKMQKKSQSKVKVENNIPNYLG